MDNCLLVLLKEKVSLLLCSECPESNFTFEDITYFDAGYGELSGFYDWLRARDGSIIGVRFHPLIEETSLLKNELLKIDYLEHSLETNGIDIFFTSSRDIDLPNSADQDFGNNRVYKSANGMYAISFDTQQVISSLKSTYQNELTFLTN